MEPEPLNSPQGEDEKLAALLRQSTPEIPDNGFSARVMTSLPVRTKSAKKPALAMLMGSAGGVIGLFVALTRGATFNGMGESFRQSFANSSISIASTDLLVASVVAGVSVLLAYVIANFSEQVF